jgi:hypothetical protein
VAAGPALARAARSAHEPRLIESRSPGRGLPGDGHFPGRFPAADGIGRNDAAWTDTRDGNTEIRFSRRESTTVGAEAGPAPGGSRRASASGAWPSKDERRPGLR